MSNLCPHCGAPVTPGAAKCDYCNTPLSAQPAQPVQPTYQQPVQPQPVYQQPVYQQPVQPGYPQPGYQYPVGNPAINPAWPLKSKTTAGILGILLGGWGIHKFYLGKTGMGILYILFCWTYVPAIIGLIEGIMYLTSNEENFQLKHHVRLK